MTTRTRKTDTPVPPAPPTGEELQGWWDFETDGNEVAGVFVKAGQGHTRLGNKATFVELVVGGSRTVTVWLHHAALLSKFRERVQEYGPIEPGERVTVRRVSTKKTSASGYEYFPYQVEFPDLPESDQFSVFGASRKTEQAAGDDAPQAPPDVDGDIPF